MNEVYSRHVGDSPPARSTVEVAALPSGAKVEIEAIAQL
jgi:2-iminobutanoate/2-iminopropanoate deaminase